MSIKTAPTKPSIFSSLLAPLTGADQLALEKARLEAFLNAFPGEYCGFHADGSVAYSDGFCALLGLTTIAGIEDVQAALETGDAAALEGQYLKLEEERKSFSIKVRVDKARRMLRLRGAQGAALDGQDRFNILWAEDITDEDDSLSSLRRLKEAAEKQLGIMEGSLDYLPFAAWLRDSAHDLYWVNSAYGGVVSSSKKDVLEGQIEIMLSPKSGGRTPKDMSRDCLAEGKPQTGRCHVIVAGKRRWLEFTVMPLPGTNYTLGLARDVTREEEIQGELDRHKNASTSLLEQLRSAIAIFSADQTLEFFNSSFSSQWGLDESWLNNRPRLGDILEKLRENRRLPEQADFRKYKQSWLDMFTRLIDPHEDMMYLPDGSAVRMLVVPHPMGGLMMTFEDVTSRLELESSYNTLIAVQKETLDNLAEGVAVYGGNGRIKLWNPSFLKLWDLTPESLEGEPHINAIVEHMAPLFPASEWQQRRQDLISHALERGERDGRMVRTDGVHVWYATMPLPDGGVMVSYYDITDSTRVEMALRDKNEALEAAEQLKTDFLANVSYQLRTPLNAIMGFSELLDHQYFGPLNERQKEYTTGIHEAGERLISLIDDILDLATIEAGYLELKKQPVDVHDLLTDLTDLTAEWARKNKIEVKTSCPSSIGTINADERRIKQAMLNLIRNAINFTPEGGNITLLATESGDEIKISVIDTGIGIADEDLQRVFQPFEKSGLSKTVTGNTGAGLGLSLVKNIVELHGGTIAIDSKEGQGTNVSLTLSAAQ